MSIIASVGTQQPLTCNKYRYRCHTVVLQSLVGDLRSAHENWLQKDRQPKLKTRYTTAHQREE